MPYWLALIPLHNAARADASASQQRAVACWALQFTPRVALLEEAVVLEVQASQRLFGGEQALRQRIVHEAQTRLACPQVAWAPNSLAALALSRCGVPEGFGAPLAHVLDALPLTSLSAVAAQQATLARLGCRTLGQVRALPRAGLSRRFGRALLEALDGAYGAQPLVHEWVQWPDVFQARLALPGRVEAAPALMLGARHLLTQMAGWLQARHAGVASFTLTWFYDDHRGRDVPASDHLCIHTASATRAIDHFGRLLSEHLARITLPAPVAEIGLHADQVESLPERSASLLLDARTGAGTDVRLDVGGGARTNERYRGASLQELLERLSARLGLNHVLRAQLRSEHRPEHMQAWQPAAQGQGEKGRAGSRVEPAASLAPQPTWLLVQPMRLSVHRERPQYQGALQFLAGPFRLESGWWDGGEPAMAARDYYVAASQNAGVLWIYQERLRAAQTGGHWYLHGVFA